jgi:hypothetical protein
MKVRQTIFAVLFVIFWSAIPSVYGEIPCKWNNIDRIVAVADIHGDYDNFVRILRGVGLVNDKLDWIGGATHLVQTGDVMDRGPNARKAFDLLKKLEKEAHRHGGMVHVLLGNHEEANLVGIAFSYPGYISPEQFASFLPEKYRKSREKSIRKKYNQEENLEIPLQQALNEYWREVMQTDLEARRTYLENFHDKYGKWLLRKNAVIKINDIIFVHGGISLEYSTWELEEINDKLRKELTAIWHGMGLVPEIVYDDAGPLWFRDLIRWNEDTYMTQVNTILDNLGAEHIVVGHTVRTDALNRESELVLSRFNGKVWGIDTGISDFYGGILSALRIQNGEFRIWAGEQP